METKLENQPQQNAETVRSRYTQLRMQTLLDTITAQRNDAQNAFANCAADKAVIEAALKDALETSRSRELLFADQDQQIADLRAALQEAHDTIRAMANKDDAPQAKASNEKPT